MGSKSSLWSETHKYLWSNETQDSLWASTSGNKQASKLSMKLNNLDLIHRSKKLQTYQYYWKEKIKFWKGYHDCKRKKLPNFDEKPARRQCSRLYLFCQTIQENHPLTTKIKPLTYQEKFWKSLVLWMEKFSTSQKKQKSYNISKRTNKIFQSFLCILLFLFK